MNTNRVKEPHILSQVEWRDAKTLNKVILKVRCEMMMTQMVMAKNKI